MSLPTRSNRDLTQYQSSQAITSEQIQEVVSRMSPRPKRVSLVSAVSYYDYSPEHSSGMFSVHVKNKVNTLYNLYFNSLLSFSASSLQVVVFKVFHYQQMDTRLKVSLDKKAVFAVQIRQCNAQQNINQCVDQLLVAGIKEEFSGQHLEIPLVVTCKNCYSVIALRSDSAIKGHLVVRKGDSPVQLRQKDTYLDSLTRGNTTGYSLMVLDN